MYGPGVHFVNCKYIFGDYFWKFPKIVLKITYGPEKCDTNSLTDELALSI